MNIPALQCAFRTLIEPTLCLPHASIPTLAHLPIPVSQVFTQYASTTSEQPDIRAVILDKDNTFAIPKDNKIDPTCSKIINQLREHYGERNLLVVSNTAGLASKDPSGADAATLTSLTGIPVLRHAASKPGAECGVSAMQHFREQGVDVRPDQVAVIGDRLFTDVVMAKGMGAWSIWVKEGVRVDTGLWTRAEWGFEAWLRRRGWLAGDPRESTQP